MGLMNRLANASNPYQGDRKKVLCVCSAGLLRSPTAAWILSNEPFGFNTRSAGASDDYALIPLDTVLVSWADEIVVMEEWQREVVQKFDADITVHLLSVPDNYGFRDERLVEVMTEKLKVIFNKE